MLSWYKRGFFRSNHFRSRFAIISCKLGGEGGGGGGEGNREGKKKKSNPTTHRRRQILRENDNNEIKMSCELNGGHERGDPAIGGAPRQMGFPQGKRRARNAAGPSVAGVWACVYMCVYVCVCCVCVQCGVCACVCAAPGLPLTSSLFRSIKEQIPVRGERQCRPPAHGPQPVGGLAAPRPGLRIGCRGLSGQPSQPIRRADISDILTLLIIISPPPTSCRALSCLRLRRWTG